MHSGDRWRLGHRPGLDGLRGVAVLAVFVYHGFVLLRFYEVMPALGVVGVGLFFTLSGFLITSLLLDDREASGRVRFGRFYMRRALRLLPALTALIIAACITNIFIHGFVHRGSVLATLFYVQNWYTGLTGVRDGLGHTWTLSIEEQFYLVWPVVLAVVIRFGWRVLLAVALLGASASAITRELLWHHGNVWTNFVGTHTKADELLVGCALAIVMRQLRAEHARPWLVLIGFDLLGAASLMAGRDYHVTAPGLTSLGAAAMIFGAAQGRGVRVLEVRWLQWLGQRSYGLYIWHVPVLSVLLIEDASPVTILAVYVPASLALTVLSWRFVEQPFLRLKNRWSADAGGAAQELVGADRGGAAASVTRVQADMGRRE